MLLYVCLRMVNFRVKVWVTFIVFLSYGIFRSQSERQTHICLYVCTTPPKLV